MARVLIFESKDATETYTPSSICITHRLGMLHLTIETTVTPYTRHVTRVLNFSLPEGYEEVSFKAWTLLVHLNRIISHHYCLVFKDRPQILHYHRSTQILMLHFQYLNGNFLIQNTYMRS